MITKKICLLGTSGVGKTSLIARYVDNSFSDRYLTSVGVAIKKKTVQVDGTELVLTIWDLAGDDKFQPLEKNYLRGTNAYLVVADGTRQVTLDHALDLQRRGRRPIEQRALRPRPEQGRSRPAVGDGRSAIGARSPPQGFTIFKTSAKEGTAVEEAFAGLARRLVPPA